MIVPGDAHKIIHRQETCRLCHGKSLELVLSLTPTPLANSVVTVEDVDKFEPCFPLDVFVCNECGHAQLLDVIDPSVLFRHYVYISGTSSAYDKYLEEYANAIINKLGLVTGSLVIEIGSNDGTLLRHLKNMEMRVLGVDPAENLADEATNSGIETIPEFFTQKLAEEIMVSIGPVRLIIANHVFAHADDLEGIIRGVRDLLSPDGVFVFEVSYLLDVYRDVLFDTIYHEHLSYHTVRPLVDFFARNGMELFNVQRVSAQGGSLRGMVQLKGGPWPTEPSVQEFIAVEIEEMGSDLASAFTRFEQRIDRERVLFTELISDLKNRGAKIAGFGAPAKATTLMYHFQLDKDSIEFIVDDNPLKQGKLTPGLHIPIVPAEEIINQKPDYLLILAWNFAAPIMSNHAYFADNGGKFIVPLPNLMIH